MELDEFHMVLGEFDFVDFSLRKENHKEERELHGMKTETRIRREIKANQWEILRVKNRSSRKEIENCFCVDQFCNSLKNASVSQGFICLT